MSDPDAPGTPELVAYWSSTPGKRMVAGAPIRDAEGEVADLSFRGCSGL